MVAGRLSFDHRADDEDEQKRIKDAGGFITRGRVLGILAVSRSFGDHGMKDFVTAIPYVSTTTLGSPEDFPMLILACDGVWDVFTDQEAVDLIRDAIVEKQAQSQEGHGPVISESEAAKLLVHKSIERGSADNITAIVIFF